TSSPFLEYKVSDATLVGITVASNVATATCSPSCQFSVGNSINVSSSNTSALNGTYAVASTPNGSTFTFSTSGVSNGTYNNAGLIIYTTFTPSIVGVINMDSVSFANDEQGTPYLSISPTGISMRGATT